MGCGASAPIEDNAAKQRHDAIEKQLKQAERDSRQDVKLLFLGAGGGSRGLRDYSTARTAQLLICGIWPCSFLPCLSDTAESGSKCSAVPDCSRRSASMLTALAHARACATESTVLKQFRLMYDKPMSDEERLGYREVILANTFQSLSVVLDAMEMLGITFSEPESANEAQIIADIGSYPEVGSPFRDQLKSFAEADAASSAHRLQWPVPQETARSVKALYADAGVKDAIARRNEFQLNDSAEVRVVSFSVRLSTSSPPSDPSAHDILPHSTSSRMWTGQ